MKDKIHGKDLVYALLCFLIVSWKYYSLLLAFLLDISFSYAASSQGTQNESDPNNTTVGTLFTFNEET